jgi:hypothetical protein
MLKAFPLKSHKKACSSSAPPVPSTFLEAQQQGGGVLCHKASGLNAGSMAVPCAQEPASCGAATAAVIAGQQLSTCYPYLRTSVSSRFRHDFCAQLPLPHAVFPALPTLHSCALSAAGASCPICGKGEAEVGITRTPCCHQLVCDTLYNYQIGTYTRDICPRSHERYTLCG